ncbi:hypothetical protein Tco_0748612 [Tanacetum coccineum]|uniref:Zinc knuckle CX2CX4HX4C n=1 Tax=Tanacetum coccineum TaxID=301880 RepID=A0ABQ4YX31_9ASTR
MLDSQGPIPGITPARALDSIQTMTDHSHKWHDGSSNKRTRSGSSNGIAAIISKLDSLERHMKKLKQNVHAIQVSCGLCGGTHLDKECPLNEEAKGVKEVKYGEFGISFPNNGGNGTRYHVAKAAKKAPNLSTPIGHCKAIFADNDAQSVGTCSNETKELHGVSFISDCDVQVSKKENEGSSRVLSCQLHPKESNPGSFNLPVEMADMSKKATMGIMENVLVKIDRFIFPSDFIVIDMLGDPNETMILELEKYNHLFYTNECNEDTFICYDDVQEPLTGRKGKTKMVEPGMGLDAVDGMTNLEYEKNLISYEFVVKLDLTYEVTENKDKVVDRKLLVSLKGELYFIDFILNPEEGDVESCVIFDTLLASINIYELLPINITDFLTFVCDMRKGLRNTKKKPAKTYKMRYDGEGPSLTVNCLKTQEELTREELEEDLYESIMLLNEKRPIIETLKYGDKHKMLLDSVLLDKLKLDGRLLNVLCQVGVTTVLANFMLLDVLVDRDVPIILGRSFMYICGAIMNTLKGNMTTFDGFVHQRFRVAKVRNVHEESDSDDDEEYLVKRDEFGNPFYGPHRPQYLEMGNGMLM